MRTVISWLIICFWLGAVTNTYAQQSTDTLRHANWRLFWSSEFTTSGDSSSLAGQWQFAYPWGRNLGGYEAQYYTGQAVTVDKAGLLQLRAARRRAARLYQVGTVPTRQLDYESGMVFSRFRGDSMALSGCPPNRSGFSYGLFEIRCRLPRTPASFSAFWLYGDPDEVDVFEAGTPELLTNNIILWNHPFWRPGPLGIAKEDAQSFFYWPGPRSLSDDFHTMAVSWQPAELIYYFDGVAIRHETRLQPLGCPLDLITNLGMYTWAVEQNDSMAVDYIRVYKPRTPWPQPLRAITAPVVGLRQLPHSTDAVLGATRAQLEWGFSETPDHRPRLSLQANRNPAGLTSLALPVQGKWLTPLTSADAVDAPRHWLAAPDSIPLDLYWTLYDLCGQPVMGGQQKAAPGWELHWPNLAPGAYCLLLSTGPHKVRQVVYLLGRPAPLWQVQEPATPDKKPSESP